jgi:hypothetical protein
VIDEPVAVRETMHHKVALHFYAVLHPRVAAEVG